jgi:hypothetical protein
VNNRHQGSKRRGHVVPRTYTILHEMGASPVDPLPAEHRRHQLTRMWGGLAAIERAAEPSKDDWRVCSDAVNLLEQLVSMGVLQDPGGLLPDAIAALAEAGQRHQASGAPIRLSAAGIQAVRAILEDYAAAIDALPARTMIRAHRLTENRIREILARNPGRGVRVCNL